MEEQRAPVVDLAVERELAAAGQAAVRVVVTLTAAMDANEWARWRLSPGMTIGAMVTAFGRLTAAEVRELSARRDVMRIALAPGGPAQETRMNDKVDPELRMAFEEHPGGVYAVVVVFTQRPDDQTLDDMNLAFVSPNEATGRLSRERIEALAKRADVVRIRSRPRPKAS